MNTWNTLIEMSRIYKISLSKSSGHLVGQYLPIQSLLVIFSPPQPNVDESQLQHYLRYCVRLSHLWEPNVTMVMTLWDYFSGKLVCIIRHSGNLDVNSNIKILDMYWVNNALITYISSCKNLTSSL